MFICILYSIAANTSVERALDLVTTKLSGPESDTEGKPGGSQSSTGSGDTPRKQERHLISSFNIEFGRIGSKIA